MLRADLIEFNKELFQKLKQAGIKLEDYKYCDLYRDYVEMSREEPNRKVVMLTLAQRYGITDRQVYNIINHMKSPVG
ncbi:MAG: hypothetical protein J5732_03005 [Bacteroidaceae bacterium]|nr:hypothetical protein [Bacteroidaceae bacterium]